MQFFYSRSRQPSSSPGRGYCPTASGETKHPEATFGQRLKAFRLAAGLTQRELSKKTGLGPALIVNYEQDAVEPKGRSLTKLIRSAGGGVGGGRGRGVTGRRGEDWLTAWNRSSGSLPRR